MLSGPRKISWRISVQRQRSAHLRCIVVLHLKISCPSKYRYKLLSDAFLQDATPSPNEVPELDGLIDHFISDNRIPMIDHAVFILVRKVRKNGAQTKGDHRQVLPCLS